MQENHEQWLAARGNAENEQEAKDENKDKDKKKKKEEQSSLGGKKTNSATATGGAVLGTTLTNGGTTALTLEEIIAFGGMALRFSPLGLMFLVEGDTPHHGDVAIPNVGTKNKEPDFVTIYKAPQNYALALKLQIEGFHAEDFPRTLGRDGMAYFAGPQSRSIAMEYNRAYEAGIIQVTIPRAVYNTFFKNLEINYQGTGTQIPIPYELFPILNKGIRVLTPY